MCHGHATRGGRGRAEGGNRVVLTSRRLEVVSLSEGSESWAPTEEKEKKDLVS